MKKRPELSCDVSLAESILPKGNKAFPGEENLDLELLVGRLKDLMKSHSRLKSKTKIKMEELDFRTKALKTELINSKVEADVERRLKVEAQDESRWLREELSAIREQLENKNSEIRSLTQSENPHVLVERIVTLASERDSLTETVSMLLILRRVDESEGSSG